MQENWPMDDIINLVNSYKQKDGITS
jgi:hypothetical protein